MKQKTFIVLMLLMALVLAGMGFAVWHFVFAPEKTDEAVVIPEVTIEKEDIKVEDDGTLSWADPHIEVGTLTYTVTRTQVIHNVVGTGTGAIREGVVVYVYDAAGDQTTYYYPGCVDDEGNLVDGISLVLLDVLVESEDAVNFVTNEKTGEQERRYADNPFLFRADEIAYLVDKGDSDEVYYDAVFFSGLGEFTEHDMAYELNPGESMTLRIGFLLGNRTDGSSRNWSDLVISTDWNAPDEKYFSLGLS